MEEQVREIASRVSRELLEQGAEAVLLAGSQARGEASEDSDIDVFAIGEGPRERFVQADGRTVGVHWWTAAELRRRMTEPDSALIAVEGLENALILDDPSGIGAELQREAREWSWDKIAREADAWARSQVVAWAEYVQKLVRALDDGRELDACALRARMALRLGEVCAVLKRVRSESENGFWETVADSGGREWREAFERALARGGEGLAESAAGALRLYALLAEEADPLLDEREREVVREAVARTPRSGG